jgi:DNA-binding NtrC family response regulator
MQALWIVDRRAEQRALLARLCGAGDDCVLGDPGSELFAAALRPDVVLLGLSGDFEAELAFAHRVSARIRDPAWVLLAPAGRERDARRLFDTLDAELCSWPVDARSLRWRVETAASRRRGGPLPLSQRPALDLLTARTSRWLSDLALPELARALEPDLRDVRLLIEGEAGTGKSLLVRYVHAFGGARTGSLIHLPCRSGMQIEELERLLRLRARGERAGAAATLWFEDIERLPITTQHELLDWLYLAPPLPKLQSARLRWIATTQRRAGATNLDLGVEEAFSGLVIRIPPLRDRRHIIAAVAADCAATWCAERELPTRHFHESAVSALVLHDWPGNLRELEAVVVHSLAASRAERLHASDLVYAGAPFAPRGARAFESVLDGEPARAPAAEPASARAETRAPLPSPAPGAAKPAPLAESAPEPEPSIEMPERGERLIPLEELDAELVLDQLEAPPAAAATEAAPAVPTPAPETAPPPPAPTRTEVEVAAAPAPSPGAGSGPAAPESAEIRRLAQVLAHELRNPLSSILTFAQLLPDRFADPEFREGFSLEVQRDAKRVSEVLERLARWGELGAPRGGRANSTELLEAILEARQASIRSRHLLVLKELETEHPEIFGDAEQLQLAFEGLIDAALASVPDRGDLYVASHYHAKNGHSTLRVLCRCGSGGTALTTETALPSLGLSIAESLVAAHGGTLTLARGGNDRVFVVDLPAPG